MRFALALAASASAARWPFTSDPLDFWAGGGKLFVSSGAASARLHLKGVSWFGFETTTEFPTCGFAGCAGCSECLN